MRKNFGTKPWLYPMPVLIVCAYDKDGRPNCMNAAWGGMAEENLITICLDNSHKTTKNIEISKAFTVSVGTAKTVVPCDYVGIASGNDVQDKMEKANFTTSQSEFVNAPIINELPFTLECKLISYNKQNCTLIGEIINISADQSILDDKGKIDVNKLQPISYDPINHTYCKLGEVVGYAFKDGLKIK